MRIRFKPYARPELAAWGPYVDAPITQKGRWKYIFSGEKRPLRVELGCGKGGFLSSLALQNGHNNYLGIDVKSEMLVVAKRTYEHLCQEAGLSTDNFVLTRHNIEQIQDILAPEDNIDRIYINFCNPWYKSGHAKHRLTHPRQLAQYRDFLQDGGEIWFKTDDEILFNDSLRYFAYAGFAITWMSRDLHREEPAWNIRTEHEAMFSERGIPIKALIAQMRPAKFDRAIISRLKNL